MCSVLQRTQSVIFYTTLLKSSIPLAASINISQESGGGRDTYFLKTQLPPSYAHGGSRGRLKDRLKSKIAHFAGMRGLSVSYASEPIMKYPHVPNTRKFKQRLVPLFCDLSL